MVGNNGGERGEQGSQEDADVTDVNGDVEKMKDMVQDSRSDHESWWERRGKIQDVLK